MLRDRQTRPKVVAEKHATTDDATTATSSSRKHAQRGEEDFTALFLASCDKEDDLAILRYAPVNELDLCTFTRTTEEKKPPDESTYLTHEDAMYAACLEQNLGWDFDDNFGLYQMDMTCRNARSDDSCSTSDYEDIDDNAACSAEHVLSECTTAIDDHVYDYLTSLDDDYRSNFVGNSIREVVPSPVALTSWMLEYSCKTSQFSAILRKTLIDIIITSMNKGISS